MKSYLVCICLLFTGLVQGADSLRVGLIIDSPPEIDNELLNEVRDEIRILLSSEYDVSFDERYVNWQWSRAEAELTDMQVDEAIDIIVGIGPLASDALSRRQEYPKPVIAGLIIDTDLQAIDLTDKGTSGIDNYNYVLSPYSVERDLDKFAEIYPYSKVGVLMQHDLYEEVMGLPEYFRRYFDNRQTDYKMITASENLDDVIAALTPDVDAIYLGPLFTLPDSDVLALIDTINARKLPSFALLGSEYCDYGVMASLAPQSNFRQISRRIAVNIQKYLEDTDLGELPVRLRYSEKLVINMETVRQVDHYPTWNLLSEAELLNEDILVADQDWTMIDAILYALNENLDIAIGQKSVQSGQTDITAARSSLRPQADVSLTGALIDKDRAEAGFGSVSQWSSSLGAGLNQIVFSEQARANVEVQQRLQEARISELDATKMDVVSDVAVAYLNVLRAKTLLRIQRENLSLNRRNLELASVRNDVGYSGPSDLYRWQSSIAQAKAELNRVEASLRQAEMQLNQLLKRPVGETITTAEVSLADNYIITNDPRLYAHIDNPEVYARFADFMVEEGRRNLPEIRQVQASLAAQERLRKMRERDLYLPTVGVSAGVDEIFWKAGAGSSVEPLFPGQETANNLNWSVGVSASIPIFTGGRRKADLEKARIEYDLVKLQEEQVIRQLEQRIRNNVEETGAAYANIELNFLSQEAARKNLDLVQDAYSKGLVSVIQLIDAQNVAIQSEQAAANAIYEFVVALILLERSIGNFYSISTTEQRDSYFTRLQAAMQ